MRGVLNKVLYAGGPFPRANSLSFHIPSGAIIGVGDRKWIPFPVMGLVPLKQLNVLFIAQFVPSLVTRARIFYEGATQR